MPLKLSMIFGSCSVVLLTILVISGIYGASALTISVTAPLIVFVTSENVEVISFINGSKALMMSEIPLEIPGKASPMAFPMDSITVPMAVAIPGAFSFRPERMLLVISAPLESRSGSASPILETMLPMAVPIVVRIVGALVVNPLIRLVTISPPLPMMSGSFWTMPVTKFVIAVAALVISCGAFSMMPVTSMATRSAAVVNSSGSFSLMDVMKFDRTDVACFIISGPLSTMPLISSVRIERPVSRSAGIAATICVASVVMMFAASGIRRGRLSVIAPRIDETISDPVEIRSGRTSLIFAEMLATPSLIFATPPSPSPEKISVRPSMIVVIPGRNSAIILFLRPVKLCVMF